MLRRAKLPVFDADAAVHRLQGRGGAAVPAIGTAFPGSVRDGVVDRGALRRAVLGDEAALKRLERIVHPLVRQAERRFLARARRAGGGWPCSTSPCCWRPGVSAGSIMWWW